MAGCRPFRDGRTLIATNSATIIMPMPKSASADGPGASADGPGPTANKRGTARIMVQPLEMRFASEILAITDWKARNPMTGISLAARNWAALLD
jgi:hypothetical protein